MIACIVDVHGRLEVPALWPHGCHGERTLGRARTSCAQAGQLQDAILFDQDLALHASACPTCKGRLLSSGRRTAHALQWAPLC